MPREELIGGQHYSPGHDFDAVSTNSGTPGRQQQLVDRAGVPKLRSGRGGDAGDAAVAPPSASEILDQLWDSIACCGRLP